MTENILEIKNLNKEFESRNRKQPPVKAVSEISLTIKRGEIFGLVGESGCGKTTLGRCLVRGIEPTTGEMIFRPRKSAEVDFFELKGKELKDIRKNLQMIFQDPYSSLNPRFNVFQLISAPLSEFKELNKEQVYNRVVNIMKACGLSEDYLNRYPHAFSGGQRQRICIARALVTNPDFIVCDEAVSALDISIQAQIINLLKELQESFNITYIFISHDLSVVEHISDRVAVMYLGRIVELAKTEEIFKNPLHPYTAALLSAVPRPDPRHKTKRIILEGEVPNPSSPPSGCHFHPRCRYKREICTKEIPQLKSINGHEAACHFAGELAIEIASKKKIAL